MDTNSRDQPIRSYPNTAASSDGPVFVYPESQLQPRATACETIKKFVCTVVLLATLSGSLVMAYAALFLIPRLPYVKLTSVSATVLNVSDGRVTADLDASFLIVNMADKGLAFDHLAAFSSRAPNASSFELCGGCDKTALFRFRLDDMPFQADEPGVGIGGDDIHGHGGRGSSGSADLKFGLIRANVTYRGKAWTKRRIPITVRCETVKFAFFYSVTTASQSQLQAINHFDEYSGYCSTDGRVWEKASWWFFNGALCFLLASFIVSCNYCFRF